MPLAVSSQWKSCLSHFTTYRKESANVLYLMMMLQEDSESSSDSDEEKELELLFLDLAHQPKRGHDTDFECRWSQ